MKTRILVFSLTAFFLIAVGSFWFKQAVLPVSPASKETKIFVIKKGESIREIANNLKSAGLIKDPLAFFLLVKKAGVERSIQAGDFRLRPSMNAYEIVKQLQHGTLDVWVTIPEGWRTEEIALRLAQQLSIPEQEFLKYAQEGYMFPDTYLFPRQVSASAAAQMMKDNFKKKVDEKLRQEMRSKKINLEKLVTLASLVEKEAKFATDRPKIAGVLLNRLKIGMKLDLDASVQYALGYQAKEKTWWKKNLSRNDLKINSPYNTYENKGLPPGPIANPGLSSIKAVLNPEQTSYLYYLSDKEGKIHYAKTLNDHKRNIRKYLKK